MKERFWDDDGNVTGKGMSRIMWHWATGTPIPQIIEPETIMPTSSERISYGELHWLIRNKFPDIFYTVQTIGKVEVINDLYLMDSSYLLCSYDDIALFLAQDQTNKMGYITEKRDCDDFAFRLKGQFSIPGWSDLCLGVIWQSNHTFNIFVTEEREILYIEPLGDKISDTLFGNVGGEVHLIII